MPTISILYISRGAKYANRHSFTPYKIEMAKASAPSACRILIDLFCLDNCQTFGSCPVLLLSFADRYLKAVGSKDLAADVFGLDPSSILDKQADSLHPFCQMNRHYPNFLYMNHGYRRLLLLLP